MANLWKSTESISTQLIQQAYFNVPVQAHLNVPVQSHLRYVNNIGFKDVVFAVDPMITGLEVVHCCHIRSKQPKGSLLAIKDRTNRMLNLWVLEQVDRIVNSKLD